VTNLVHIISMASKSRRRSPIYSRLQIITESSGSFLFVFAFSQFLASVDIVVMVDNPS